MGGWGDPEMPPGQLEAGRHHFGLSQRLSMGQLRFLTAAQPTATQTLPSRISTSQLQAWKSPGKPCPDPWGACVRARVPFSRSRACEETVSKSFVMKVPSGEREQGWRKRDEKGTRNGFSFSLILREALGLKGCSEFVQTHDKFAALSNCRNSWSLAQCHPEKHQFQKLLPPWTCLWVIWESQASPLAGDKHKWELLDTKN